MRPPPARLRAALQRHFGLAALRPGQQAVIERVLAGRPTLAVMPTGAGKSLCYQLPALLLPGRTIVVSPLIALMKDQCEALRERGVRAVQINSALDGDEARAAEAALADGSARIVMTTPERLADPAFVERLAAQPVSLLAVDEAHCLSQWGHDFRPAFLEIGAALQRLGRPTVLALTATAPEDVAADIHRELGIPAAGRIDTGAYRANLRMAVEQVGREQDKLERALALLREREGCGIVYTATVRAAEEVAQALQGADLPAGLYHGRLPAAQRTRAQDDFMEGRRRLMVATNAFGLGIDKPDIRFVLHYQMPGTLEAYYQEAGRAGRDGEAAHCTLLFLRGDKAVQQFFLAGKYPGGEDAVALCEALRETAPGGAPWTLPLLQARLARPRARLQLVAGVLRRAGVLTQEADGSLRLARGVPDGVALVKLMDGWRQRRERDRAALERMVFYAQTGQCRWRVLLESLDDEGGMARCGHCDNCLRLASHEAKAPHVQAEAEPHATDSRGAGPSPRFEPGQAVRVRRYGRGEVEAASAVQVAVRFADGARRSFLPEYVAPVRQPPRGKAQ